MKARYCKPFITVFFIAVCISTAAQNEVNFPDDFVLQPNEMPTGFVLRPMDEDAKKLGLTGNPSVLTNTAFYTSMYPDVDTDAIKQLQIAIYSKPESPDREVGTFVAEYHSAKLLAQELEKVIPGKEMIYLTTGKYMVLVWSDGGQYVKETRSAADHLKKRLNLEEVVRE